MRTRLSLLHRHLPRRTAMVVAGLALAAGIGTAAAPAASAAPAAAQSPADIVGVYQLFNYGSFGLCLDIAGGSNQAIVNNCDLMPVRATQAWEFPTSANPPYLRIEDTNHNCLGVEGNSTAQGAAVVITSCAATPNREWQIVDVKTVFGIDLYEFVNRNSGLCLTDDNDSDVPGHKVNQSTCHSNDAMLWYFHLGI
jgi:hypothetical protein